VTCKKQGRNKNMKRIVEILICMLLIASTIPAVKSENNTTITLMVPYTRQTSIEWNWTEI